MVSGDDGVFGEGLEAVAVGLDDGDGGEAGLAGVDVAHDAGLPGVRAGDDFAAGAVLEFGGRVVFGVHGDVDAKFDDPLREVRAG